jgi:two-component system phosphate regulon response regulator PhoB
VNKTILIVDPDAATRHTIVDVLETQQVSGIEVETGAAALEYARDRDPDLVLTELVLSDITGLSLCRRLREDPSTAAIPVVVMSAYADEMDRIISFELGVDDFVPKPFSTRELAARLRAILRRPSRRAVTDAAAQPQLDVDPEAVDTVAIGDQVVQATPRELQILAELIRQGGRVVTREELIRRIWSPQAPATERTVDAHIKSLRRKLGSARSCIRTVRGVGYRYDEPASS